MALWRGAKWLWGAPLVACVTCMALAPALFLGRVFFLRDAQSWFYPSRIYLRERLLAGTLPEWMPELNLGMPFLADPGNGTAYPLNLLLLLPAPGCVSQFVVVHVLLAALGTYHLLQVLGLRTGGRVVGALTFGLSGYVLSMTSSGVYLLAIAWMPLVVARGVDAYRRTTTWHTAWFAAALGCQLLAGEPQGVQFTLLLLVTLLAVESPQTPQRWAHTIAGVLLGVGLALPTVLPAAGFLMDSKRQAGMNLGETSLFSLHPLRLAELLAPGIFGNAHENAAYLGYFLIHDRQELSPWVATLYCGSLSIVLAVLAVLSRAARRARWAWAALGLLLLTTLLALGRHTPVFAWYQALVPGAGYFRYPAKFFALVTMCLALIAALGADQLERARDETTRLFGWLLAALTVGLGLVLLFHPQLIALLHNQRPAVDAATAAQRLQAALLPELGVVLLTLLFVALVRRRPRMVAWLAPTVAGALVLQLALANQHLVPTTRGALYVVPPPLVERMRELGAPDSDRRLFVPDKVGPLIAGCLSDFDPETMATWKHRVLKMNTGIVHGVHYARSYTSFATGQSERVWNALASEPERALDLLSVGYVIGPSPASLPQVPGGHPPCFSLRQNRDRLPYARVVPKGLALPSFDAALTQLTQPEVLRGELVLVETDSETRVGAAPSPPAACRHRRQRSELIEVHCDSQDGGWVVVNEAHNSNWTATVDGTPAPLVRANGIVMAVAVEPGPHEVVLSYSEPLFRYALTIAGLAALALLAMLVGHRRRLPTHTAG